MKGVKVIIPPHECRPDIPPEKSCIGQTKVTTGKTRFRCPDCGKLFEIRLNLAQEKPTAKVKYDNGSYLCSVTDKELTYDPHKGEIYCNNDGCDKCDCYPAKVFTDKDFDQGFAPGQKVEKSPVRAGAGKNRLKVPPASILKFLGLKGLVVKKDDIVKFRFDGEVRVPIKIGENLYDIGHDEYLLWHQYTKVKNFKENVPHTEKYVDDEEFSHIGCLIDKRTYKAYALPKKNVKIFGFSFEGGKLYKYVSQRGLRLADAQAFKANTRFIAYKVNEVNENNTNNKDEETWGYLVKEDKFKEFISLALRSTRIFANKDYSGIAQYDKLDSWKLKHSNKKENAFEVMEEDDIYHDLLELESLIPHLEVDQMTLGEFEIIEKQDLTYPNFFETLYQNNDDFLQLLSLDDEFKDYLGEIEFDEIISLYNKINNYIKEFCQGYYGKAEDVLYHLYCDAVDPNNTEFTRWSDNFNGGKENQEYYRYSNRDLFDACKTKHVLKNVSIYSNQNQEAIKRLFMIGVQHPSYGNPLKSGIAQKVAFDFENPYDEEDEVDFSEYDDINSLLKDDPDLKTVKIWGDKPQDLWSDKDYKRHNKGKPVKEIRSIMIGAYASEKDPITRHFLYGDEIDLIVDAASSSRVLPPDLKTRYIKNDENYGSGYFTPAVHVWKGLLIEKEVRVLGVRVAHGGDCSIITAALEINEELYNQYKQGKITFEEFKERRIIIVLILHSWYASATFNNKGLMSIIHKTLHYFGYVYCNEPYRKKNVTAVRYTKNVDYFDENKNMRVATGVNNFSNPTFTYFDRRIERTNKLMVDRCDRLNILCRSQYSGTSNTRQFADKAGKEIIDITSPLFEVPEEFRYKDMKEKEVLDMYRRFCQLSENDPIQKDRSTSTKPKVVKQNSQRRYNRMYFPEVKAKFFYYKFRYIPMNISKLWDLFKPQKYQLRGAKLMKSLRNDKHQYREKILYVSKMFD